MHTLRADHIQKTYYQNNIAVPVLQDINYTFKSTNSYAISGVSGTGKSTLMHLLAGIDTPNAGTIFFDELAINTLSPKQIEQFRNKKIGVVFQESYLISELTVIENVMICGLIAQQSYKSTYERALELLNGVGLTSKAQDHPKSLSGGQQQKIAILRALFNRPQFLLADEPTGSLDRESVHAVIDLLKKAHEQGMGLIVSSHDPIIAQEMQQRLTLNNGILEEQNN